MGARCTAIAAARTRRRGAAISTICCLHATRSTRSSITPPCPTIELPAFMRDLRERDGVAALALEFAILTATRTGETLNATWSEFDLDNKLWTIPPERMKGGREHRVPLCGRAVAIVKQMRTVQRSDFVFPGAKRGKPLNIMAMLLTLRRMGRGDLTAHGFRATFRTWATEKHELPARGDRGRAGARHR